MTELTVQIESGNAGPGNFQVVVQLPTRRASATTSNGNLLAMPELSSWISRGDSNRSRVRPVPCPLQVYLTVTELAASSTTNWRQGNLRMAQLDEAAAVI